MSCLIDSGLSRACKASGGIYTLYLASRLNTLTITTQTDGKITDIDNDATPVTFYPYDMLQKTIAYKEARLAENGAIGFEKTISGTIVGMSQEHKDLLEPMEHGESIAIIKTKSDKYFLVGEFEGLEMIAGEDGIGAGITDLNGYAIELSCQEGERSNEVVAGNIVDGVDGAITVTGA